MKSGEANEAQNLERTNESATAAGYEGYTHSMSERSESDDRSAEGSLRPSERQDLREFHDRFPAEYTESRYSPTDVESFGDPERIAVTTNPKFENGEPWQHNCADCARAFESTWRGQEAFAAGRALDSTGESPGEDVERMESWCGPGTEVESLDDVAERLRAAGHGSSAIVETMYQSGPEPRDIGGHAFNLVNHNGEIRVVDAQMGRTFDYQNGSGHPLMDRTWDTTAWAWDAEGENLWTD